jgi:hypothetical protein
MMGSFLDNHAEITIMTNTNQASTKNSTRKICYPSILANQQRYKVTEAVGIEEAVI